jgi:ferredoxin
MEKQISFSDFLKEGALKEEHTSRKEEHENKKHPIRLLSAEPVADLKLKSFWKDLRKFYRTGEKENRIKGNYYPVIPSPYLKGTKWLIDYPFFLPEEDDGLTLKQLLAETIDDLFEKDRVKIIRSNLGRILEIFRKSMEDGSKAYEFGEIKEYVFDEFIRLEVHGNTGERFIKNVQLLKEKLPEKGKLINFSSLAPLYILRHQLKKLKYKRIEAAKNIEQTISDLEELILIESKKQPQKEKSSELDFASNLISIEKVEDLIPHEGGEKMSEERFARIKDILNTLNQGKKWLGQKQSVIIATKRVADLLAIDQVFDQSEFLIVEQSQVCQKSHDVFDSEIEAFTPIMAALRMAKLELKSQFNEEVHTEYFKYFNWHRLTAEEIDLAPSILLFSLTNVLLDENLSNLSKLLSANKPIKVCSFSQEIIKEPNPFVDWEDASYSYKQDIVSFGISQRGTHTFQGSLDQPLNLSEGYFKALKGLNPSLINTLIPAKISNRKDFIQITSAVEGRYFPILQYDVNEGKWGSRFNIDSNPQPEKDWPEYLVKYENDSKEESEMVLPFTYADYKALNVDKVAELMLVPEEFATDNLLPIATFLNLSNEELTGKVPFIWLVDEENVLVRAAMPYMWAISCQERLEYWNYIQELGGVNSHHVETALKRSKEEWENEKSKEIEGLKAHFQKEIQKTKDDAVGNAMKSLSNVLMDFESFGTTVSPKKEIEKGEGVKKKEMAPQKEEEKPQPKEVKKPVLKEVTLDSFNCTSCNDCIDKLPAVFAYNEDKQAYVKDPNKGSYEEIVEAAEGCPARCIHPGLPKDPKDPKNLEWIKRASKFN